MLTRQGWGALVVAAAAAAIGRVFGLIELYVVAATIVLVVAFAVIVTVRRLPSLSVRRRARPAQVTVGDSARIDLVITNESNRRVPTLQLWEPVGPTGGAPMLLGGLGPFDTASAAYRVPTGRRGVVQTGPLRTQRGDPFGICQRTAIIAGTEEVLVLPRYITLPFPTVDSAGRLGQHLRMKAWGQQGSEFHALREYVPGDDQRRIHWRASARSENLIVRETALEGIRRCTVLLDTAAALYTEESFEAAVAATASVMMGSVVAGLNTRVAANDVDFRGPAVATSALRWLATVGCTAGTFNETIHQSGGEGLGLVVLVTGSEASPLAAFLRDHSGPDDALVTVCCTEAAAGRFTVDGTSLDALAAGWSALVTGARRVAS